MREPAFEQRMAEWTAAYAGAQFLRLGYSSSERIASAATDMAPAITLATPAAEIERIVTRMEQAGRWREGRVLRAEYFMATLPEAERLQRLSRIGLAMSRSAYYVYLAAARAFVAGALLQRHAEAGQVA